MMPVTANEIDAIKRGKFNLHPVVQLLALLLLIIELQNLQGWQFVLMVACLILLAFLKYRVLLLQMLRRTRWLFLSMLLLYLLPDVYAYVTGSGSYAGHLQESAVLGGIQVLHLAGVLASISLMTGGLSRSELLAGLIKLLKPLVLFGIEIKVLAVRVMLTMHYLEQQNLNSGDDKKQILSALFKVPVHSGETVQYSDVVMELRDKLLYFAILMIILNIII